MSSWDEGKIDASPEEPLVAELRVTDQLLESCRETLALIPECPVHGFCHPHMQAWIRERL